MPPYDELLDDAARRARRYLASVDSRPVRADPEAVRGLERFEHELPEQGLDPAEVLRRLDEWGADATTATMGARYFGFVIGGALPAAVAADWLASAWDQNAGMQVVSPVAAKLEEVAAGWVLDVLGLPASCGVGFVTGATMANLCGLAAARHALLSREGWDVERDGLFGAPPLTVVVGAEVHASVRKALALLGLGRERVVTVPTDDQGAMHAAELPPLDARTIVCVQAGNVNTGAFDPTREIARAARAARAWVHVDGAFGLWALASSRLAALTAGLAEADSWATDAHKWLNVPYDSGLVVCRDAEALRAAHSITASYLVDGGGREPAQTTPELSRRARGLPVWAALLSLGRAGLRELVERCCAHARLFAALLAEGGAEIPHTVVLNQVLVSLRSPEHAAAVLAELQAEGSAWCGGTVWHGRPALRISVSSWRTSEEDVRRTAAVLLDALARP